MFINFTRTHKFIYKKRNINKLLKFTSKAETLEKFKSKYAKIPVIYSFTSKEFINSKTKIIKYIQKNFKKRVIVRSSFYGEDSKKSSNAGKYQSVSNVNPRNNASLDKAINKVLNSKKKLHIKDKIFIQEFFDTALISGVATSCCLQNYSPYINISYTDGKDTSLVTSGKTNTKKIQIFYYTKKHRFKKFTKLISLIKEIVKKFNNRFIEIEFAIDKYQKIYLFQIRPIVLKKRNIYDDSFISLSLSKLRKKIKKLQIPNYDIIGNTTYFGVMPDWNPAEIIGKKPKPLAISLYQELVTDHVWSQNRKDYGFKDLKSHHLMTSFLGTPYVDTRVDFNSWLPQGLSDRLSKKLIKYYLEKFKKQPALHDKIEFEILFTCYTPTFDKKIKKLKNILTPSEIKELKLELVRINQKAYSEFYKNDNMIKILERKQNEIRSSNMYHIDKIYWLVEDCKNYGTYPFAGLARCAFIAVDILNSLEKENLINKKQKSIFLNNIKTISSIMQKDFNKITTKKFIDKYGHLRPNTYDINSKNYRESFKAYFSSDKKNKIKKLKKILFNSKQKLNLKKFIKTSFGKITIKQLFLFMKLSIEKREYAKFIFTKNIDAIFQNIKLLGKRNNINQDDLAYLKINDLLELYYNLQTNVKKTLIGNINNNKEEFKKTSKINLPDIIYSSDDIYAFEEISSKPNYITNKSIAGETYLMSNLDKFKIKNKIVLIQNADPGYDFLFNHKIKALITMYGGANSHMAIRCAELGIPAVIGIGENKFLKLSQSKRVSLDCNAQLINVVQ